jgi:ketosteroid isomerase-like protein
MFGYLKSDSLRFASGGNVSYGWQTTLERYAKGYPDKEAMGKLTFSKIDIKIISEDAALVFGKWELERESDSPWGLFTLLFKYTETGWRIVHDHTSSAAN